MSKPHLSCPFSRLSIYPLVLWMDSISVCIWSHFFSSPCLFIYLWADCNLFWCPIVQLSVISKHSSVIRLRFHPFQFPLLFLRLHRRTSHWAGISRHIHSFPFLKAHCFFIAAISLLFKSTDNVFLSILLHPFQRRVQGFSLFLSHSLSLSLSFQGHLGGPPSTELLLKLNCLSVMSHDEI